MTIQREGRNMRSADRRQILDMALAGMTDAAISRATTWSVTAIEQTRKAAGLRKPEKCAVPPDAIARMREMRAAGDGVMAIVAATGYGQSAVRHHTRGCAPPRTPKAAPPTRLVHQPIHDEPAIAIAPTTEDRWREALAGRRFTDAIAFDAGRGRVGRVLLEQGTGRSSMACA